MSTIINVPARQFADEIVRASVDINFAHIWIAVLDGTQGTRRSMRGDTPQARLDEYADAEQNGDDEIWHTDADELRAVLTAMVWE